jgi:hypothetical protein
MLHQARRLRQLLKSNPFGFPDQVLAQFVHMLRHGIRFAKTAEDGDGADLLDESIEFVIPPNDDAEADADAAQLYEGLDEEIDLTEQPMDQEGVEAMDVSPVAAEIDLNGSIPEQPQDVQPPASTGTMDSSVAEGILDSELEPPPSKRAKTEETTDDNGSSESANTATETAVGPPTSAVQTATSKIAGETSGAAPVAGVVPPSQPPKQSMAGRGGLAYRGRGGYPLRGRGRGGFRGGMMQPPQQYPHPGFYQPNIGGGGFYPPQGNVFTPGYFQPMPGMPGPPPMQPYPPQHPQLGPGPGPGMQQHPAFLPQYLQTPQVQQGQRLHRPRGGLRRIAPVGIMGAVASGPTRFQRGSFRGFSATQAAAEKSEEGDKKDGVNGEATPAAPAQLGKQHDDNFQLDSKFVSALLAPAPQQPQPQQPQQQQPPPVAQPAPSNVARPAPPAQNLEEAQKRLLDRKRLERDGGQGAQAQLSSAETARLEDMLRDDRLYDVIESLKERQHKRDRELNEERNQLIDSHRRRLDEMTRLNAMRLDNTPQIPSKIGWVRRKNEQNLRDLEQQLSEEMRKMTAHIVQETDELTRQQQRTLESFGVPGFFVTNDSAQIALQSRILNRIADGRTPC